VRAFLAALALSSVVLSADDHSVLFDEDVDFSTFKTFTLTVPKVKSARPELNFPAVTKSITESIRTALSARNLKEVQAGGDLLVECDVTGVDWQIGPFGRPSVMNPPRGRPNAPPSPREPDFTEATIVLDLKRTGPRELVWRGVYHDIEEDLQKLADALPKDVTTLLEQYPAKKKK
jgi:hypothetical protein